MSGLLDQAQIASLEAVEVEVMADLVAAARPEVAARLLAGALPVGGALALSVLAADVPMLNRVFGPGLGQTTEAQLDVLLTPYRDRGLVHMVQLVPAAERPPLTDWLAARGLRPLDNWVRVLRGDAPAPAVPTDLRVEPIGPERGGDFAAVVCAAFGIPPALGALVAAPVGRAGWRHYLALDGDQPVAAGALAVVGDVGWLGFGATLASHRRRGAQGALMARRIADGLALGCRRFVSEAEEETAEHPNPSLRNMLRTGFEIVYARRNFVHGVS